MKKQLILLASFIFGLTTIALSQSASQELLLSQSFQSDNVGKASFFQVVENNLRLTPLERSSAPVELRLLRVPSLSNEGSMLVIELDRNNWQAAEYKYFYKTDAQGRRKSKYKYVVDEKRPAIGWDQFWQLAVSNGILTLPGQQDLQSKIKNMFVGTDNGLNLAEQSQLTPTRGTGYYLEIKVGNRYRYYGYENPDLYTESPEMKNLTQLLNLFLSEESASL